MDNEDEAKSGSTFRAGINADARCTLLLSTLIASGVAFVLDWSVCDSGCKSDSEAAFCGAEGGQFAARMSSRMHSSSSTRCNTCPTKIITSRNSANNTVEKAPCLLASKSVFSSVVAWLLRPVLIPEVGT